MSTPILPADTLTGLAAMLEGMVKGAICNDDLPIDTPEVLALVAERLRDVCEELEEGSNDCPF